MADTMLTPLTQAIAQLAKTDGDFVNGVQGLAAYRRSEPTIPMPCIYTLGIAVIAQGGKQVILGQEIFELGSGHTLLTTVDLPVMAHVSRATKAMPYLGLTLALDEGEIIQLASEMDLPSPPRELAYRPISLAPVDGHVLNALTRLLSVTAEPALTSTLVPLIRREITARLLAGPHGPYLQHIVAAGSPSQAIARIMTWLKDNFHLALGMEELAVQAHMSPSTFRQHFRKISGMSPLQYQKQLRLQEARRLMLNQRLDAGEAGLRVGYESVSQFSREYSRLFGAPPQRDVKRLLLGE
ncbi:AraC family transcriptional regulator [Achromobacter kerstersii]|uniref:HTH-type transcriptional activator RhaR n=1 Tax=Achromobacter kerstersii TaxID=1353890 RepID=A0A6S7ABP1_9BURK|nr:AraC family transcriptional regulator [Achromobacter kerstersii]CAB3711070.1 HTH-type transcriptional activator RhaR [Achromobacter kerstersii]